jgi:hypothetical protein
MKLKFLEGKNNSFFGKYHTKDSIYKIKKAISGKNYYNYGKIAYNAKLIYLYDLNNNLIKKLNSAEGIIIRIFKY